MSNYFQLDLCASNRFFCVHCLQPIALGSLRARKLKKSYHLRCFRPPLCEPIIMSKHICMRGIDTISDINKIRKWVDRLNAKFILTEKQLPAQYRSKQVKTIETQKKRLMLLIFAYLSSKDVETAAALTCKEWFHVTRVDELWKNRFIEGCTPDTTQTDCCRQKFIVAQMNSCWHCKKLVTADTFCRRCSIYKRPLCMQCSVREECSTISVDWYLKAKMIQISLVKSIKFLSFREKKIKTSYFHILGACFLSYAEKRRQLLIKLLAQEEYRNKFSADFIQGILHFELLQLYSGPDLILDHAVPRFLIFFCGQDTDTEDLRSTMKRLLEHPFFRLMPR